MPSQADRKVWFCSAFVLTGQDMAQRWPGHTLAQNHKGVQGARQNVRLNVIVTPLRTPHRVCASKRPGKECSLESRSSRKRLTRLPFRSFPAILPLSDRLLH